LVDDDDSVTNSVLLIATFFGIELVLSFVKQWMPRADHVLDSAPLLLVADGRVLPEPLAKERVSQDDILEAARHWRGLERLDQIKYAVLELNGEISIIPKDAAAQPSTA
jgi:uncharacterized membrane protein YcaP (DUF421 family)